MNDAKDRAVELNFSWVEGRQVAGSRGPKTDWHLSWLAGFGIRALVRLAPEEEERTGLGVSDVEGHAIHDCYEPVPDCTAPSQEQLDRAIAFIKTAVARGDPVAVSCGAGCGRTGTVLACYLVAKHLEPQAAIDKLIAMRPCSAEVLRVPGQKDAVFEFHRRMRRERTVGLEADVD